MPLPIDRDLHRVRHLFTADHLGFVLDAMIAGNTPARGWADDDTALVWDRGHTAYLAGAIAQPPEWRALFDREIAPAGFLKLYVSDTAARTVFAGYPLQHRERILYRGYGSATPGWRQRLPAGFQVSAINDRCLELSNGADVIAEIESCWNSLDAFLSNGFGFVAHDGRAIVSWCTAEYVSDTRCGVGIETVPAYYGRGFASATASAMIDHCADRGMTPHWDAWTDNLPSVAVAEKVGLRRVGPYSIYVLSG